MPDRDDRLDLRPNTGLPARAAARAVVGLRWLVVPAWIAAAVACALTLPGIGGLKSVGLSGLVPADAEALATQERSLALFDAPLVSNLAVVVRDPDGLSGAEQARIARQALRTSRGEGAAGEDVLAVPVPNALGLFPGARERGTAAITYLVSPPDVDPLERVAAAERYAAVLAAPGSDAFVGVTGALAARDAESRAIQSALPWIEGATVALVFVILAAAFRSVVAPLVALLAAGIAFVISERVVAAAAELIDLSVPREVEPLLVVLLLGIVTDYAVFFLAGTRRRLAAGVARVPAAWWTGAQYLPIITTAGLIVALGAATILVGRLDFFRAFGPGLALTVLVGLLVAVTIIPALLGLLGRLAYWPSRPGDAAPAAGARHPRLRGRGARLVGRRSVAAVVVVLTLAGLGAAASGLARTELALTPISGLPGDAEPLRAYRQAAAAFAPGIVAPTEILLEGEGVGSRPAPLGRLTALLADRPGVAGVVGPGSVPRLEGLDLFATDTGAAARYLVVLEDDPYSPHAVDLVRGLEAELPRLLDAAGLGAARARLAGDTALAGQAVDTIEGDLARIGVAVVLVNVVLLALFLRSLVAPLYLVAASALALAAAVGLATYVFDGLLGGPELTSYVPLAAGVLLVSLGADYNLFVVGRIWQEARRRPLREAIAVAVPRASRAVTVAGVTLALSFGLLAIVPLRAFREFAFVMAVGILLDTFVVRSFLVPGLISLVGRPGWWPGRPLEGRVAPEVEPAGRTG